MMVEYAINFPLVLYLAGFDEDFELPIDVASYRN